MNDLVKRLRKFVTGCDRPECKRMIFTPLICEQAADRIEQLEAALWEIASGKYSRIVLTSYPPQDPAVNAARAAMEEECSSS